MITADAHRLTGTGSDRVEIQITVTSSDRSLEIGGVFVLDNQGHELVRNSIPDCAATYERVISVSQRRLPITLRVTECGTGTPHEFPRLIMPDPGVRPCDPADTSPPPMACSVAQDEVRQLSETMQDLCDRIASLRQQIIRERENMMIALGVAAGLLVAAAVASAFGPFGALVAIGLAALAAMAALAALAFGIHLGVMLAQRADANRRLSDARSSFDRAVNSVRSNCCEHEIRVDLVAPC